MSFFRKKDPNAPDGPSSGSGTQKESKSAPWVEKYRPKNLDDVAAQDHAVTVLKRTLQSSNLPHMLFYGPPGTGKTSTVLALAKELFGPELFKSRVLELNASDERGISIVREKVKNFARTVVSNPSQYAREHYPCPPYKIIILDEADSMTSDAQSALRRTMETYSKITRFCLICNYVTRIIDPLASRCSKFRFKPLDTSNALQRLQYIAREEDVKYEPGALERLLDSSSGDLRKAITLLQSSSKLQRPATGEDDAMELDTSRSIVTKSLVDEISGTVPNETIDALLKSCRPEDESKPLGDIYKDVIKAVQDAIYSGWSATQIINQLHDRLLFDEFLTSSQKSDISWLLSHGDKTLSDGADEHLVVLNTLTQIAKTVNVQ